MKRFQRKAKVILCEVEGGGGGGNMKMEVGEDSV